MKTIGRTNDGGYLVEMRGHEFAEFTSLAKAVEGVSIDEVVFIRDRPGSIDYDFEGTFGAIRAFREALFRINDLQALLGDMKSVIMSWDKEK